MKRIIIVSYLRKHQLTIIVHCLLLIAITFILYMYSLPIEAMRYCYLLIISCAIICTVYDFWKYYRKHQLLFQLSNEITVSLDKLPEPTDILEVHYQNLIKVLYDDKCRITSQTDAKYAEFIDYYTLWAHQIKTPIAAMRLLLQSEESPLHKELTQELFKIEQYVEMVLQYLRIESMSSDLLLEHYQLSGIVKQAMKKYASMFIYKKIKLNLEEIDCTVLTDEKWLLFVIEQLLSNALKYTNAGGGISIYMDKTKEKTLVIEDTGIGIQEEDLPRIFEKGFTGYNGRMDKKSTGIGLFLCRRILQKLSHKIMIISVVGEGTKVYIDLSTEKISII